MLQIGLTIGNRTRIPLPVETPTQMAKKGNTLSMLVLPR